MVIINGPSKFYRCIKVSSRHSHLFRKEWLFITMPKEMRSPLQTRKHLNYCLYRKQKKWLMEKKILSWKNFLMSCKISPTRPSIIIQIKWTSPAPAPQLSVHHLLMIYGPSLEIRTFCYKSLLITSSKGSNLGKCMFKLRLHW